MEGVTQELVTSKPLVTYKSDELCQSELAVLLTDFGLGSILRALAVLTSAGYVDFAAEFERAFFIADKESGQHNYVSAIVLRAYLVPTFPRKVFDLEVQKLVNANLYKLGSPDGHYAMSREERASLIHYNGGKFLYVSKIQIAQQTTSEKWRQFTKV